MYSAMHLRLKADEVREKNGLLEVPINLEEICRAKNIEFEYRNFCKVEEQVKKQVSGMIVTKKENGAIIEAKIYINEADPITRQRFTLAHELGHYFLHLMDESDTSIVSFRYSRNPREREADRRFPIEIKNPLQSTVFNSLL